jgi:predicted GNAT family acetyltransferase
MADLCRLLLASTPIVTLFVRTDNVPAIRLYEKVGMRKVLEYRSVLF